MHFYAFHPDMISRTPQEHNEKDQCHHRKQDKPGQHQCRIQFCAQIFDPLGFPEHISRRQRRPDTINGIIICSVLFAVRVPVIGFCLVGHGSVDIIRIRKILPSVMSLKHIVIGMDPVKI